MEVQKINKKKHTHREIHIHLAKQENEKINSIDEIRRQRLHPKSKYNENVERNKKEAREQLKKVFTYKSPQGYGDVQGF